MAKKFAYSAITFAYQIVQYISFETQDVVQYLHNILLYKECVKKNGGLQQTTAVFGPYS